jgi:VacB/RNase II family 3'-5' exoribonuclease
MSQGVAMSLDDGQHRTILRRIARTAMLDKGLLPDFSPDALTELEGFGSVPVAAEAARDLTDLPWASIDNDDSLDLDQLTVAQTIAGNAVRILVAVADVDSLVRLGDALDDHARHNTASVYTAAEKFPMLPDKLSTDLTSLNHNADRPAVVVDMLIAAGGEVQQSDIYLATVRSQAKLAYNSVAAWLENAGPQPEPIGAVPGLDGNLRLQSTVAQRMKSLRHVHGALSLETIEAKPVFEGEHLSDLQVERKNLATDIVEDFMIAANGVTARYLTGKGLPSIRRVVRTPKRWDRIVELAAEHGTRLPAVPDAKPLEDFLNQQKAAGPLTFPDLSLSIIKLLGPGEYVAERPGDQADGHFGLAVKDYTHSTAPNRRFTDLITQRLLKAALSGGAAPYTMNELTALAAHCTEQEDAINKVERQVSKSAAALLLESRIGEQFDALVTGASPKGTWARLLTVPVEGRVLQGFQGLDVGQRIRVELASVDVERGFIDLRAFRQGRRR